MSTSKLSLAAAGVISALTMGVQTQDVEAANWLMLQGTERTGQAGRAKVWGFIQPEAQYVEGSTVPAGGFKGAPMQPNTLGPDRNSRATMNIRRARIGVRGQGFPLDNKTNYFILAEFGHNGITSPGPNRNGAVYLTDASITLNHIPFARMRIGQFKTPGSEEGLQAIHVFDYINFTNGTDQLLLERYADGDGSTAGVVNAPRAGVGAFRDIGAQLFDTIKVKNMEYSYAAMIGNGNGINAQDNNNKKDLYGYIAAEMVFGGKGGRREGAKVYAWTHQGKRTLTTDAAGDYDRDRSGLGFTYRQGPYRAAGEYIMASGLIRNGTDGGAQVGKTAPGGTTKAGLNYFTDDKANAYYLHLGYAVMPKLELDLRYDVLNRGTDAGAGERQFTTTTVGAQYFINKKTRIIVNYEFRSLEAPELASSHPANQIGDAIDNRASVQMLAIF